MTTPAAFVDSRLEKGVLVLTVTLREITEETAGSLRVVLLGAVPTYAANGDVVVLDLSRVEYLSGAGTSVLLALKYRLLAVGARPIRPRGSSDR
jgi:anti-anti-sigma regulatory factor